VANGRERFIFGSVDLSTGIELLAVENALHWRAGDHEKCASDAQHHQGEILRRSETNGDRRAGCEGCRYLEGRQVARHRDWNGPEPDPRCFSRLLSVRHYRPGRRAAVMNSQRFS